MAISARKPETPVALPRRLPRGLRYVSDADPGIRRQRRGRAFVYIGSGGHRIRDERVLARIRKLAIPPAYKDVWICSQADGHVQASGRDARGRKQYRYHAGWREFRDTCKYEFLYPFGLALPALRRRLERQLRVPALTRDKVLAIVVSLLDRTLIRVGNEEYARTNSSYGLTTLRTRHVRIGRGRIALSFRGKTGKAQQVQLSDARLARLVRRCQELPGQLLFQYLDADGKRKPLRSSDVNAFLAEALSLDATARTFRTWGASAALIRHWQDSLQAEPALDDAARLKACISGVAQRLGNTVTVCRNSYLDPRVIEAVQSPQWAPPDQRYADTVRGLSWEERALAAILKPVRRRRTAPG